LAGRVNTRPVELEAAANMVVSRRVYCPSLSKSYESAVSEISREMQRSRGGS
jgi:hypothetical protein